MYEKYLQQIEEAGKIRNLKQRTIDGYKSYVSYFLKYMNKNPEELTCQDVREFLLRKKDEGLKVTERAKLLGHSVDTNLKHYTFARTDDYLEELSEKIDAFNATERRTESEPKKGTSGYLKIIDFQEKQKNLESAKFKAL